MPELRRLLRALARWYAVVAMLVLIFALSSIPNISEPRRPVIPLDKVAHFGEYAALAFVLAGSLRRQARDRVPLALLLAAAVAFGALYGVTDEFHQSFVPGRDPALSDWLADLTGCAAGALASAVLLRVGHLERG